MIEFRDGVLSIRGGGTFVPKATEDEFLKSEAGARARLTMEHGAYRTYSVASEEMPAQAHFRDGRLWMITLARRMPDEGGWTAWSKEQELERKRLHDDLLEKALGPPPYVYTWGKVESVYDAQDGSSSIVITYS